MARTNKFNLIYLFGAILIIGGIFTLFNEDTNFYTLEVVLGSIVIICGVMQIVIYNRIKYMTLSKITLLTGIMFIIIGIILIFKPSSADRIFEYIVAIFFIINAINNLINSNLLKPTLIKTVSKVLYVIIIIPDFLLIIGGIILLLNPLIINLSINLVIGLPLIASGIKYLIFALFDPMS